MMKEIGFSGYLTKPIKQSYLYDCFMTVLGKSLDQPKDQRQQLVTRHSIMDERKKRIRILLAEDNIVNQKLALRLIEKFGYSADATANGDEAVKALEMIPYDIVLMDIQMPEKDGIEATNIIRDPQSKVINHQVPIIALTAHAMKGDKEKCIEAGMDGYISKPINPDELLEAIEKRIDALEPFGNQEAGCHM
jgi:two-component system sensor histidine kinase/response regulator